MKERLYTPGPWEAKTHRDNGRKFHHPVIRAANGKNVASIVGVGKNGFLLARSGKEGFANARLMAAAPEMLDLCRTIDRIIECSAEAGSLPLPFVLIVPILKSVIEKAL